MRRLIEALDVINMDTPALSESEEAARQNLVALCRAMLDSELSFFEGAVQVCALHSSIRVSEDDPDIMAFVAIKSETDHWPMLRTQQHWYANALRRLQPEFDKIETWAKSFAVRACNHLIARFSKP